MSFVLFGLGCACAALCYAEFAAMIPLAGSTYTYPYATLGEVFGWIIGWDLTLEYAMGASTVSSGWSNNFIELLSVFHLKTPCGWHTITWPGCAQPRPLWRARWHSDGSLVPGTQAFVNKTAAIVATHSPDLVQQAHELLGAPLLFGREIGVNLPAFLIAILVTMGAARSGSWGAIQGLHDDKLGWMNWALLIIWLVIGLVVYFLHGQKNSRVQAALSRNRLAVNR